jgi:hypothetical protein
VYAATIVTERFRMLAEFTLANTEKVPEHPMVVLDETFEYVDGAMLESVARTVCRTLFAEGGAG